MPRTLPRKSLNRGGAGRALLPLLFIAGCASLFPKLAGPPAWVSAGGTAVPDSGISALYGVGVAERNITNVPLSKVTAKERARVNLALALQTEIQSLLPVPVAKLVLRPVIEAALPHYKIVDTYLAPDGARAALARLPYSELVLALKAALADPSLIPADQAAELVDLLSRNLAARGISNPD